MSQYASTSIPKPNNWQDFESHTCILFQCILNDPNTVAHGRSGQAQQGVDVYGRRERRKNHWVGVQCKLKSDSQGLTKGELEKEVSEAKKFRPPLSELIIVTTAPNDAKIQQVARSITQQHEKEGLFSVDVWGWGTLEREITKHWEAINAFHPDQTPFSRRLESLCEDNLTFTKEQSDKQDQILDLLYQAVASSSRAGDAAADKSSAAEEAIEKNLHSEIDGYRDLLQVGRANTAKNLLESLKIRVWESASKRVRFRITTNIGAAHLALGEEPLAVDSFLEAITYDPHDPVGLANVALTYLLKKELQHAVTAAERALEQDPYNATAAGHLISGHIHNESISDPFSVVPEPLHDTPDVLASAINFLAQRNNAEWRRLACQAAERYRDKKHLQRLAAEAVLDEAASCDHFAIGGAPVKEVSIENIRHSALVLQSLWDEACEAEGKSTDRALLHNLALALWILKEFQAAANVLDHDPEHFNDDVDLCELRAALYFETGELDAALALIGDDVEHPGLALMQAQSLVSTQPKRARAIIQGKEFFTASQHQRLAAEQLIIETFVQEGLLDQALTQAEGFVNKYPGCVTPLVELARVQRKRVNEYADETLTRTIDMLGDESSFQERFILANALQEAERYDDVGAVLKGHVDVVHDSPALRLLMFSYINADRLAASFELLSGLPDDVASQPSYLKALAAINAKRKDFPAAREALDRYLELSPGTSGVKGRACALAEPFRF